MCKIVNAVLVQKALCFLSFFLPDDFVYSSMCCFQWLKGSTRLLTCRWIMRLDVWQLWLTETTHTHTHTRLMALFPGQPGWAGTRKVKPFWILLKHETVSGSGISWAMCKSAPRCRHITMSAPHHSVFYRPDALPAAQPTASKHWRHETDLLVNIIVISGEWQFKDSICWFSVQELAEYEKLGHCVELSSEREFAQ